MPVLIRVLSFVRPYKPRVALAWVCVIGSSVFVLATPQIVGWAIDTGLKVQVANLNSAVTHVAIGNARTLTIAAVAIILSAALRGIFSYGQMYLAEWVSQRAAYDIRNAIFDRLERLSHAYHDKAQTGQLMSRATQDVEAMRLFISFGALRMAYILILLFAIFVIMVVQSWQLALVAWAVMPIVAWRSISMTSQLAPIWMRVQDGLGRLGTVMQENFSGVRVVKAFSREKHESKRFAREAEALFADSYSTARISAFNSPIMSGLSMLALVGTVWFGGWQITQGHMEIGELTSFMLYLTILQMPVRAIGWIVMMYSRAAPSAHRIYEILDAESAVKEKHDAHDLADVTGAVRFDGVSFRYNAVSPVLDEVSFEARPNEVVALLGPTGSGKTTVVSLIPRFYDVTAGTITIDGLDIRDATLASLRRNIGIVQQDVFLFSATIRDNIAYGVVDATQEQIEDAARTARIHDFIAGLPDGYDTWVGERGVTLSGGEKQRIAIARTLLMDPRILILDDSTSSVDTETEYLIRQALGELMKGRTTFVIAQRLRTVKNADQILVLRDGRIAERGRHRDLLRRNGFYRQIYDLELRDQEEALQRHRDRATATAPSPAGGS